MLNKQELSRIYRHAYLPEHLPHYVEPFSGAKAHLIDDHLCYLRKDHLVFIGYPISNDYPRGIDAGESKQVYLAACKQFQPLTTAVIAPEIWQLEGHVETQPTDLYYRLKLPLGELDSGVAYMVRRAAKELRVEIGNFGREHRRLVKNFISRHKLSPAQKYIFRHIHHYLNGCSTAHVLEARIKGLPGAKTRKSLAAFTIVDLGSEDYAYYLFSFRSNKIQVPGAADLLLRELVNVAETAGKKMVNLGLGINAGIRHFKEKWGGTPFLDYNSMLAQKEDLNIGGLAKKL